MGSASKIPGSGPGDADDNHHMTDAEEIEFVTALTKAALQRALLGRNASVQPASSTTPTFIKYAPSVDSAAAFDSVTSRFIRLSETPLDPLAPPKFKSRRVPRPAGSPPVPVMSSPPRPPSRRDQHEWRIPPCISGWKNPKGYTIPLDKRQRALSEEEQNRINDNFALLMESLQAAERKAREAVRMRSEVRMGMRAKLVERREQDLRRLARSARTERAAHAAPSAAAPVTATEVPGNDKSKAKHGVPGIGVADAEEKPEKVTRTDEGLSAGAPARTAGKRERPAELDEPEESDDPFDLDGFMAQVKKGDDDY